jgi:hypothetical protein
MKFNIKILIAVFFMTVWIFQAFQLLTVLPDIQSSADSVGKVYASEANKHGTQVSSYDAVQAARSDILIKWSTSFLIAAVGIFAAISTYLSIPLWRFIAILSCLSYIFPKYYLGALSELPIKDALALQWQTAQLLERQYDFLFLDILIPVVMLMIVIYLVWDAAKQLRIKRGNDR